MKIFKKILLTACVVAASSCTLDLVEDPNAVQPDQALPSLVLNSMQRSLADMFQTASSIGMQVTRLQNAGSSTYETFVTPQGVNGIWTSAYADILQDANSLIAVSDANGYARHAGMTRIIQAYTLVLLVDYFGDVPFSQAFQGSGNFNPSPDAQSTLYTTALSLIDQAKLDLKTPVTTANPPGYLNPVAPAITDHYYPVSSANQAPDFDKWIRFANTLKLKIYLNLGDAAGINALITETPLASGGTGGFISTQDQNFVFRYGTSTSNPDARHPRFTANYLAGGGNYMSNWLMWHMFHGYDATSVNATVGPGDPRMRFYFYRQVTANSTSSNEIRCLTESVPSHYPSSTGSAIIDNSIAGRPPMGVGANHPTNDPADPAWTRTFCFPTDRGYWGRDHVDPQGIPPDAFLRTAWGAYPAGGRFDNSSGAQVASSQGMRGAGIQPIMMRAYVEFMLSEAALTIPGVTTPSSAQVHFENGIRYSMNDVRDFAVNGRYNSAYTAAPNEASTITGFYSAANFTTDVNNYVTSANAAFAAVGMNYVAREYWIALFGNGVESYNLYRRTGMPTGMQPVINPQPGFFPRSFWYPANAANLNSSISQKADLSGKVFWDKNSTNLNF